MAFEGKKVAQINGEMIMEDATKNKRVKWLKAKAAEIAEKQQNQIKAFSMLRKAYLGEFYPELLAKKKAPKKGKSFFEKIAEMED